MTTNRIRAFLASQCPEVPASCLTESARLLRPLRSASDYLRSKDLADYLGPGCRAHKRVGRSHERFRDAIQSQ